MSCSVEKPGAYECRISSSESWKTNLERNHHWEMCKTSLTKCLSYDETSCTPRAVWLLIQSLYLQWFQMRCHKQEVRSSSSKSAIPSEHLKYRIYHMNYNFSLCGPNMFGRVTSYCIYAQCYTGETAYIIGLGLHSFSKAVYNCICSRKFETMTAFVCKGHALWYCVQLITPAKDCIYGL